MKSDIEIAQNAKLEHILNIAKVAGIDEKFVEQYGNYKAKINLDLLKEDRKDGKLILVTAITPTPAGEGKTTTTIGLADGLKLLGKNVVVALREPSLGPVFGVKVVLLVVVMPKLFLWKTLTCTLRGISTQLAQQITYCALCLITIYIKVIR